MRKKRTSINEKDKLKYQEIQSKQKQYQNTHRSSQTMYTCVAGKGNAYKVSEERKESDSPLLLET